MAIHRMCGPEEADYALLRYPGHEMGRVRHDAPSCPLHNREDFSGALGESCTPRPGVHSCWVVGPVWMQVTHRGLVLDLHERNMYDDSDFLAVVWNPEMGRTESVEYASTRGWSYPNHAGVDATEEVYDAWNAWRAAVSQRAREEARWERLEQPRRGRLVRVISGRKVKVGLVGEVSWAGKGLYGDRVGIRDQSGHTEFTSAKNVEVIAIRLDDMDAPQ
jgi:hypothetical protein